LPNGPLLVNSSQSSEEFPAQSGEISTMDLKIPKASTSLSDVVDELRASPMQVSTGQDRVETHLPHAENSMSTYQYRPLLPGHIRCLTLHPGTRELDVEVPLLHFSLQDDPSSILQDMEALSYTWSTPTPAKIIHCRNEPGKTLVVSPNLYDALVGLWQDHVD
jgi:hypothetical protein